MDLSIRPRTPLETVTDMAAGRIKVAPAEQRRIMLMAVGQASTGHGACERCPLLQHHSQTVGTDEYRAEQSWCECGHKPSNAPMDCKAVAEAHEAGLEELEEVAA